MVNYILSKSPNGLFLIFERSVQFDFTIRQKTRPFSVPFYPIIPLIAISGGLFVLISQFMNDPIGVLLFSGITAIGWPIFFLVKKMSKVQTTIIEDQKF